MGYSSQSTTDSVSDADWATTFVHKALNTLGPQAWSVLEDTGPTNHSLARYMLDARIAQMWATCGRPEHAPRVLS